MTENNSKWPNKFQNHGRKIQTDNKKMHNNWIKWIKNDWKQFKMTEINFKSQENLKWR